MQNLSGKNSIIGKSIVVKDITNPDAVTTEGCCVIGDAAPPTQDGNAAAYAHNHHHPHHGHGSHEVNAFDHGQYIGAYNRPSNVEYNRGSTVNPYHA